MIIFYSGPLSWRQCMCHTPGRMCRVYGTCDRMCRVYGTCYSHSGSVCRLSPVKEIPQAYLSPELVIIAATHDRRRLASSLQLVFSAWCLVFGVWCLVFGVIESSGNTGTGTIPSLRARNTQRHGYDVLAGMRGYKIRTSRRDTCDSFCNLEWPHR